MSGGIDSATCLYLIRKRGLKALALTVSYHAISPGEVRAAAAVAKSGRAAEHRVVRLPDMLEAAEIEGAVFPGKPGTYIPMRNSIFYGLAAAYAEEKRADSIVGGHNRDDLSVYEDAGDEFFDGLQKSFLAGSRILRKCGTIIERPLSRKTKPQVVRYAVRLGVPLELTWSCHRDGAYHCWRCPGCLARAASFAEAGVRDPLGSSPQDSRLGRKNS